MHSEALHEWDQQWGTCSGQSHEDLTWWQCNDAKEQVCKNYRDVLYSIIQSIIRLTCLTVLECFKVASLSKCIQFHSLKNNIHQISSLKEGCPTFHLYRPFLIIMHSVLNWEERKASEVRALFYMQNKTLSWWSLPSRNSAGDFPGCPALTLTLPVC